MSALAGPLVGLVAFFLALLAGGFHATPYNNFVLLADAFRHGRTYIDWPGAYIDALPYHGRYYVIEAPLPAVLLLPAVALGGTANQSFLSALLTGVAAFAGYEICRRLGLVPWLRLVLCGLLLFGTDLFWAGALGDVWFIAHVSAVAFTLLALLEVLGARRAWLVALFAACAVESRFAEVAALPVFAAMFALAIGAGDASPDRAARLRKVASFCATLVPFVILYVLYNEARWGGPLDIGYTAWFHQDSAGSPFGSPFAPRYLTYQLQSFFVQGPAFVARYPYVVPSFSGVALTWTSPAFSLAFFARGSWRLVAAMWAAVVLTAVPNLVYYVNGYAQFGMRHALDFEPFLFVLVALAARRSYGAFGNALWGVLIAWSTIVGAWGLWYWRAFVRH